MHPHTDTPPETSSEHLRSVHTRSFAQLLHGLGVSLLVSTYQAGKLVVLREKDGLVNTHFRMFDRPMGVAADGGRFAVGTAAGVTEYRNMRAVAQRLDPPGVHDAVFLPRLMHVTGNIDIHELAYAGDELWFVNTLFSCLCTLDGQNSFVPRWRPPFVSGYAAEDRCHLNGLEIVEGHPRYVTALGVSDKHGGWRDNKASGGVLMEVPSGEVICRGLSMPHSPRWHDGELWLLESGNGSLSRVDPLNGTLTTVATLPGFTRGLAFCGPYAFIGLSQVRESAVFSGIKVTEHEERNSGVWVVDVRSGTTVAFLRFEAAVHEVFAVALLPGIRFPEVLENDHQLIKSSYALPEQALAEVQAGRESSSQSAGNA